jgi:hypothetical protein
LSRAGLGGRVIGMAYPCPECNKPCSDSAARCPHCGRVAKNLDVGRVALLLLIVLGLLMLFGVVMSANP